jgi:hypothetical protein
MYKENYINGELRGLSEDYNYKEKLMVKTYYL